MLYNTIDKVVVPFVNHFCIFCLIKTWTFSRPIYAWNILFAAGWIRVMMLRTTFNKILTLWGRIPVRLGVLDTTLYDNVCQWLASGGWFSPVFSTNKTDRHETTEILLKVVLSIITLIHPAANNMFHAYIGREQVQEFIKQNIQKYF
jgi:hypothetical protein